MNEKKAHDANVNPNDRKPFDWKSKYPIEARKEIRYEAFYIVGIFLLSFALLLANFLGLFASLFALEDLHAIQFEYIMYFSASGLLGGIVFGMKFFYRMVARGYWTQDRRYWRIFSPIISMCVAFIVGAMASAGILTSHNSSTNTWAVAFGFFAGYFADEAVGKMYEMATLLFGKTKQK